MIRNENITTNEKAWLETMLSQNFLYRKELVEQINSAKVIRDYHNDYLLMKFECPKKIKLIKTAVRVPIEMRVYTKGKAPAQFLLHIREGTVSELEVFYADSSAIDVDCMVHAEKIEVLIASE